jgi:hypothetical protein
MVFTTAGYVIRRCVLDEFIGNKRLARVLKVYEELTPYTDEIKKAFNDGTGEKFGTFDKVFCSVDVISLQHPNAKPEGAIHLVRADGDPYLDPDHKHYFIESNEDSDRMVKAALGNCLGFDLGGWFVREKEYDQYD